MLVTKYCKKENLKLIKSNCFRIKLTIKYFAMKKLVIMIDISIRFVEVFKSDKINKI